MGTSSVSRISAGLMVVFACLTVGPGWAATYYISPTGSDLAGDGSRDNPWYELEVVVGGSHVPLVQSGDEIVLLDGVYNYGDDKQSVYQRYFDPNNPVVIRAENRLGAILEGAGDPTGGNSNSEGVGILYASGVILDGLEIRHSGDNALHMGVDASYITIRNCKIHDAGSDGDSIKVNHSHHIVIENCEVYDPGYRTSTPTWQENIDFMLSQDCVVRYCLLYHTAQGGDAMLYAKGDSRGVVFENNVLRDQYAGAWFPPVTLGGTFHDQPSQMIDDGVIGDDGPPPDPDLNTYSCYDIVFRNNLVMRATRGSVAFTACDNGWVVNNVFYDCAGGGVWFLSQTNDVRTSRDCHVYNNIFYDPDGDMGGIYRRGMTADNQPMVVYSFSAGNNLFYNGGAAISSTGFLDANVEVGAVFDDPDLVSPGAGGATVEQMAGNYRPLPGSSAIDAGADMGGLPYPEVLADFDGAARPAGGAYDIGMFEYRPGLVASEPPPDGTLPKTQNNVILLTFDGAPALPGGSPALSIVPLAGGIDVGSSFACSIEPDGVTLKAVEGGAVLADQTWYQVTAAPGFEVSDFALEVCALVGDANGSGRVTTADYSEVKAHMSQYTDARYDLNGSGRITTADYSVVKANLGHRAPTKP